MEKTTMKTTIKIVLVISLFCATAFAGHQTAGGYTCGHQTAGGKCLVADDTAKNSDEKDLKNTQDDLLIFVRGFLAGLFR